MYVSGLRQVTIVSDSTLYFLKYAATATVVGIKIQQAKDPATHGEHAPQHSVLCVIIYYIQMHTMSFVYATHCSSF